MLSMKLIKLLNIGNAEDRTRTTGLEGLDAIHYTTNPFISEKSTYKRVRIKRRVFFDTDGIRTRAQNTTEDLKELRKK